jgi:hypothetical protein
MGCRLLLLLLLMMMMMHRLCCLKHLGDLRRSKQPATA